MSDPKTTVLVEFHDIKFWSGRREASRHALETLLTLRQCAELYNIIAKRTNLKIVKRFADRSSAVRRVLAALQELPVEFRTTLDPRTAIGRTAKRVFNFEPIGDTPRKHREGTARATALGMLLAHGATLDEISAATGWDTAKKTYEGVYLIHKFLGYGLRTDENGKIYAYTVQV